MKYIKTFKLFETGEWSKGINWEYVKNNPDDDSEESWYIRELEKKLNYVITLLNNKDVFVITNISGLDLYQGAYANVKIFGRNYKVSNDSINDDGLFIERFPIDNCSEEGYSAGFLGSEEEIAELLNDISASGYDIELYKASKKYNI